MRIGHFSLITTNTLRFSYSMKWYSKAHGRVEYEYRRWLSTSTKK